VVRRNRAPEPRIPFRVIVEAACSGKMWEAMDKKEFHSFISLVNDIKVPDKFGLDANGSSWHDECKYKPTISIVQDPLAS